MIELIHNKPKIIYFQKAITPVLPTKEQFKKWSLPSKIGYISAIITILSFPIGIIFYACPRESESVNRKQLKFAQEILDARIIEGSKICCEIEQLEAIMYIPPEGSILIPARLFLTTPTRISPDSLLSIAYSGNSEDTIKSFDCNNIGANKISLYYFINQDVFCKQTSILHLRDPNDFCFKGKH